MNQIRKKIISEIKKTKNGISIDRYISLCLFDKNGYYYKSLIVGKKGDYITAPEISQLFGEIIGLYIYHYWNLNINNNYNLIELGPGKGTLCSDIIRINKNFNKFIDSTNLNLIEINKQLIKIQKKILTKKLLKIKSIIWKTKFEKLSGIPSIIFANEFFDCFPVRQFRKKNNKWYEKMVNYNLKNDYFYNNEKLIRNKKTIDNLDVYIKNYYTPKEGIIEISKSRILYFKKICDFLIRNNGLLILIDYGEYIFSNNSTLESIINHKHGNIFENPGLQDITSHVNFKELVDTANSKKLYSYGPFTQREFLIKNGIDIRKRKILSKLNIKEKEIIQKSYERIINKNNMGNEFKFLIISSKIL